MKIKQKQGFNALHAFNIKVAMNGTTVRNVQVGGSFQFHTNTRINTETSCVIIHRPKAVIIITELRTTFLLCSLSLVWWFHDSFCIFLVSALRVHAIASYTIVKMQMGTRTKAMKVAVAYLLCVSMWLNAGSLIWLTAVGEQPERIKIRCVNGNGDYPCAANADQNLRWKVSCLQRKNSSDEPVRRYQQ